MNYYSHHIGDHLTDTAHLSILEDGSYRRLMDRYYATEQPLPHDEQVLFRLLRARSEDEKEAVRVVLAEFFTLTECGWSHKRCELEIAAYKEKSGKAADAANKRWNKPSNANAMPTQCERNADAMPTKPNNQEPITNNQEPVNNTPPSDTAIQPARDDSVAAGGAGISAAGALSIAFRKCGIKAQPANPKLMALAEQGVTPETVTAACLEARAAKPDGSAGFGYVMAIIERWGKESREINASGAAPPAARASPGYQTPNEKARAWADQLTGKKQNEQRNPNFIDINTFDASSFEGVN